MRNNIFLIRKIIYKQNTELNNTWSLLAATGTELIHCLDVISSEN